MVFAFMTVVITVHAYVFYSLYVINGSALMSAAGTNSVLDAINAQGGVYMLGAYYPIWAVVLLEFVFAYTLEIIMGSPCSFKLAARVFDPKTTHPVLFETAIICATAALMCPAMSLVASFAVLSQLFFIQPLVRVLFRALFRRDLKSREVQTA